MNILTDQKWLLIFTLGVIAFTAYSFNLKGAFDSMDDQVLITSNATIHHGAPLKEILTQPFYTGSSYYRPLALLSYRFEFKHFGFDAFFYHLDNNLLHVFNVILVFFLSQKLFLNNFRAFLTALLFAVHPINWEPVALISGRPILLCTFFFLSACVFYLQFQDKGKNTVYYFLSVISFILGLLCKEEIVMLPFVLVVYEWIYGKSGRNSYQQALLRLLPFGLTLIIYFLWRDYIHIPPAAGWEKAEDLIKGVSAFIWALILYSKTFISGTGIYYDRSANYITGFTDLRFWVVLFVIIEVLLVLYRKRFNLSRKFKFFLFWIFFTLLPVSQLVPIKIQEGKIAVSNHFFYLPSVAIFFIAVHAICVFYERATGKNSLFRTVFNLALVLMMIVFINVTVQQNFYGSKPGIIFRQTLLYEPDNIRIRQALALEHVFNRDWIPAERQYRTILALDPMNIGVRISLGRVLIEQKRYEESRQLLESIRDVGPFEKELLVNKKILSRYIQ